MTDHNMSAKVRGWMGAMHPKPFTIRRILRPAQDGLHPVNHTEHYDKAGPRSIATAGTVKSNS